MPENKCVLLVTYDSPVGKAVKRVLANAGIPDAKIVETFEDACARINSLLPDVVITDWTNVNGAGVIEAARDKNIGNIIVIDGGLAPREELLASGINVVSKPFTPAEIIAAVRREVEKV